MSSLRHDYLFLYYFYFSALKKSLLTIIVEECPSFTGSSTGFCVWGGGRGCSTFTEPRPTTVRNNNTSIIQKS